MWLTLSWRDFPSYRNQFIDLQSKSIDCFLYDRELRHERVNSQSCQMDNQLYQNKSAFLAY